MRDNKTKAKLKSGETVFGCFLRYPDPGLAEFLCYQGWDFIVLDAEHGTVEPRDCEQVVRCAELRDVTPIIRVTTNAAPVILRFMDTGAQGAHVPWVNSAAEAEQAIQAIKYEPRGVRGLGGVRAADYGQTVSLGEYIRKANNETLSIIHVETAQAIEELEKTVRVDGVDVIFIGPSDLSQSLGVTGQTDHPKVAAAMNDIVNIVSKSDVALGIMVGSVEAARKWQDRGARYITITFEAVLRSGVQGFLKPLRTESGALALNR